MSIKDYIIALVAAVKAGREEEINRKLEGL